MAVTGSTRNRLGGASRHVGSNPTPSAIFRLKAKNGVPVGFEREPAADEQEEKPDVLEGVRRAPHSRMKCAPWGTPDCLMGNPAPA